ncbi:MAG: arsenosugar biosynthesis radical SAM (seleno)protein ArsS [Flavobacteriales bacterium]
MAKTKTHTLHRRGNDLANPEAQKRFLAEKSSGSFLFEDKLRASGLYPLRAKGVEILQINLGYKCDLTCEHCHVDAGPDRKEVMDAETVRQCIRALDRSHVTSVDLTGGAPEMNPGFVELVKAASSRGMETIVRSNLTILVANKKYREYPAFFRDHGATVVASLPCYTADNTDKQRGEGVFDRSIEALQKLNEVGYGKAGTGLELDLVFNPGGPALPPDQEALEQEYKKRLAEDHGIVFNKLFTITNLPISRFLEYLVAAGKFETYMETLVNAYNPAAAEGVMCRNTLSVDHRGYLFDCDFNQMLDIPVNASAPQHISEFEEADLADREIRTGPHCFGCTAGAGSTCQGSIA